MSLDAVQANISLDHLEIESRGGSRQRLFKHQQERAQSRSGKSGNETFTRTLRATWANVI